MHPNPSVDTFDFVTRANPDYVDALHGAWERDPRAVDERWRLLFSGYELGAAPAAPHDGARGEPDVAALVRAYRDLGHLVADLDPLGAGPRATSLLSPSALGLAEADLDRPVRGGAFPGLGAAPLRELMAALAETYAGPLGVEYLGVEDDARRRWLEERMESTRNRPALDRAARRGVLEALVAAETFEQFLQARYVGQKRFSLEGGEALIPLLHAVVEEAARLQVVEIVLGMPHRGRLNVLAHLLGKPYEAILAEFEGARLPDDVTGDGDVKYHLGYSQDRRTRSGRTVHLSLASNPSHLEAIDPVVAGLVRAKQDHRGDRGRRRVVPLLLHGDAAIMGQGVVYETLALSGLAAFTTGGTIHVIVNNQIGFTTPPEEYLFTRYPSGPARMIRVPVFHVNGDDPEAAVQAARLAVGYRQAFGTDVFVDFVCYRRHGHNELDDPSLTQPVLYEQIRNHPSVVERYVKCLAAHGVLDQEVVEGTRRRVHEALDAAQAAARREGPRQEVSVFGGLWSGLGPPGDDWTARTAVEPEGLRALGPRVFGFPPSFTPHPRVARLFEERRRRVERGVGIDWGTAELLAYGSLLLEGTPVRLSGQDAARGTFGHRHAAVFDSTDGRRWVPLAHVATGPSVEIVNSPLSEAAVLGFELGMSMADPRRLVVWEAQFGDFANGAQVVIDQFITSGESKWQRATGLALLLPHGYEGQGPEHSSARLERFLQLCAERNLQVVQPTTPAQLFHVLRRQVRRAFRKPLVVMTPKSLLRHAHAVSTLDELAAGGFRAVLDDPRGPDPARVRRVLLCTGKLFYTLDRAREDAADDTALVRIEELYPFPHDELAALLRRYAVAVDRVWAQEEPANQGAWGFVRPRLAEIVGSDRPLRYVGRDAAASPATGLVHVHQAEEAAIVMAALGRSTPDAPGR